jgi:hypothetical protein
MPATFTTNGAGRLVCDQCAAVLFPVPGPAKPPPITEGPPPIPPPP